MFSVDRLRHLDPKTRRELGQKALDLRRGLTQKHDTTIDSPEKLARILEVELGCAGTRDNRTCGERVTQIILFGIKPGDPETPQGSRDAPIPVCAHHSLGESNEFEWVRDGSEPYITNARVVGPLDYIDGNF